MRSEGEPIKYLQGIQAREVTSEVGHSSRGSQTLPKRKSATPQEEVNHSQRELVSPQEEVSHSTRGSQPLTKRKLANPQREVG